MNSIEFGDCIFISPPQECSSLVNGCCVRGDLVQCLINHRRLMLTEKGRTRALRSFITRVLDDPGRIKPVSGQIGRELLEVDHE